MPQFFNCVWYFKREECPYFLNRNTTGTQLSSLDWYDKTAGRFLESTDYFIENHIYEVQLWVEVKDAYDFRINSAFTDAGIAYIGKNIIPYSLNGEYAGGFYCILRVMWSQQSSLPILK